MRVLMMISVLSLCTGCLTQELYDLISEESDPRHELARERFTGSCKYDPETDTYYVEQLLKGKGRIAAVRMRTHSFKYQNNQLPYAFHDTVYMTIEEIDKLPEVTLKEVPFQIRTKGYGKADWERLVRKGLLVYSYTYGCYEFSRAVHGTIYTRSADSECGYKLKYRQRNTWMLGVKRLGFLVTVPVDLFVTLTSPIWDPPNPLDLLPKSCNRSLISGRGFRIL